MTNFIVLPLYFVSDVFVITDPDSSSVIQFVGDLFPIRHLATALQDSFNPFVDTVDIPWTDWAVLGAWGVFGLVVASRTFRWAPRRSA